MRNPKYSLRAFARDIGISFSRLSEILSSDTGISVGKGQVIAKNLQMTFVEREYFLNLIIAECGRSRKERDQAALFIKHYKAKKNFIYLNENIQKLFSKWYYVPLVELLQIKTEAEIADILDISREEVLVSILVLEELGLVSRAENGRWRKLNSFQKIESKSPSTAIRQAHREVLTRASKAIENQAIDKRKYLSSYFAFKKENILEARQELEKFNEDFLKKYAAEDGSDAVYVFSMQLFELG